jgi:uncharacterized heparinase superfamily protein
MPFKIEITQSPLQNNNLIFNASHDGYKRLKNKPIHKRSWFFNNIEWFIEDNITGENNEITSRYYLHPNLHINIVSNE